jgi:hypothetical protein
MHEANYCIRGSAMNNTTYKKTNFRARAREGYTLCVYKWGR